MIVLKILRPGMLTTVQDDGRWGFQAYGVPVSGPMDAESHQRANALVGNGRRSALLEVTLLGPQIEFELPCSFAVVGAEFHMTLNETPVPMNVALEAPSGTVLRFGHRLRGARAYIAVSGGIDVPEVLGSRSTHVASRLGGYEGRPLRAGDRLPLRPGRNQKSPLPIGELRPGGNLPDGGARVRVVPGDLAERVLGRRFRISTHSDRMGYRLEGHDIAGAAGSLLSEAMPMGAIQLPPSGEPIVLMADHATTGGYAVAATVITADLPIVGQLAAGDWIEFDSCTLAAADAALRRRVDALSSGTV